MRRPSLTLTEMSILWMIARGKNSKNIGDKLHISERMVKKHAIKIMEKFEVLNRLRKARG